MTTTDSAATSLAETMARLRGAQKGHARGAPAYSVYVNRRIGRLFAAIAYRFGLTPNQVTLVSAAHTFVGIALAASVPATWWSGILIAALLVAGYAWDSADGQVARLLGGGTVAGEWLDHFVDALKIASLHLAVLIGLYRFGGLDEAALLVPIGYSIVATVTFFGMILNDLLKGARGVASTHERAGGTLGRSLLLLPTDFGAVCLVFLLWGVSPLFLVVYAALFTVNVLFLVAAAVKWFREMRRVG
ncbi:CDP-alcohol phosphatidyltransferase family protein [Microbacterium sp. NPDC091382]|uniref:CDP-alcohol phosphatidyltransferase family protein n=1 Tax=Microbacterium sp. NPDC091382 TaxID=3364210 RepID=UPI0037F4E0DD